MISIIKYQNPFHKMQENFLFESTFSPEILYKLHLTSLINFINILHKNGCNNILHKITIISAKNRNHFTKGTWIRYTGRLQPKIMMQMKERNTNLQLKHMLEISTNYLWREKIVVFGVKMNSLLSAVVLYFVTVVLIKMHTCEYISRFLLFLFVNRQHREKGRDRERAR